MLNAWVLSVLLFAPAVVPTTPTPAPASTPVQLHLASVAPPDTPWMDDLQAFTVEINAASHGLIKAKVLMSAVGGHEADLIRTTLEGNTVQMLGCSTASLVDTVPALEVLEIPFLFEDGNEADFVIDKYVTEPVRALLREKGLEFFTWAENGWQNIGSRDVAVRTPKDLIGMQVRSQASIVHLLMWRTFGANPISMSLAETGPALQAGKVGGFAQTTLMALTQGWTKSIKHFTVVHHIYQPFIVAYNKRFFDAQSPQVKTLLQANPGKYAASNRKAARALEEPLLAQLAQNGVDVVKLTPQERNAFREAAHRVQDKFVNTAPPEALALLRVVMQGKAAYAKAHGDHQ